MEILTYIVQNGDLKLILLVAILLAYKQFGKVEQALTSIAESLKNFRTVDDCSEKHGLSCKRLDILEDRIYKMLEEKNK